jgi:hypothetical protein
MNQRVHIHKEALTLLGEVRHFSITLPPDVEKITAIKATATPKPPLLPKNRRWEIGRLRFSRDGAFLCDMPVWFEAVEPLISPIVVSGVIEQSNKVFLSGTHSWDFQIEISGEATVLNCLFRGSSPFDEFTLSIYIYYKPKS